MELKKSPVSFFHRDFLWNYIFTLFLELKLNLDFKFFLKAFIGDETYNMSSFDIKTQSRFKIKKGKNREKIRGVWLVTFCIFIGSPPSEFFRHPEAGEVSDPVDMVLE